MLSIRGRFERGGGPQKLFGIGLAGLDQRQAQIEIGLKDTRFGRDRLAVGRDGVVGSAERVIDKSQVEPRGKVLGIVGDDFFQQRFGSGVVLFFDRAFSLDEFGRGRGILDFDLVVADGFAGGLSEAMLSKGKQP